MVNNKKVSSLNKKSPTKKSPTKKSPTKKSPTKKTNLKQKLLKTLRRAATIYIIMGITGGLINVAKEQQRRKKMQQLAKRFNMEYEDGKFHDK